MNSLALKGVPPLVSVIMPTRGRRDLIGIAIQSVVAQSHERWELIIVNDGGPDISDIVARHQSGGRIIVAQLPEPRGAAAARNVALCMARGSYIAYLDDDDWYDERHLAVLVETLETTDFAVAYTDSRRVVETEDNGLFKPAAVQEPYYAVPFSRQALLVNNYIPILALMHKRELLDDVGVFDESLEVLEDWELWIRMSRHVNFLRVPRVTCNVRWREDGSTTTTGRRRDHFPSAKRIYDRYPLTEDRADMRDARRALLGCLEPSFRNTPPTCSIIVTAENADADLADCLDTIAAVTQGVSYEVVVVDNGSSDATAQVALSREGECKVIVLPNPVALGEALQRGADEARGRFLVFVSPTHVARHYWLRAMVEEAELHGDIAGVCAKLLDLEGAVADAGWSVDVSQTDVALSARHRGGRAWDFEVSQLGAVDGSSAVMLVRRSVFDRVGGLDRSFESPLATADLSWRLADHGRVVMQPGSVLYDAAVHDAAQTHPMADAAIARDAARLCKKVRAQRVDTVVPDPPARLLSSAPAAPSTQPPRLTQPAADEVVATEHAVVPKGKSALVKAARDAMERQQLSRAAELVGQLEQVAANDVETLMVRGVLELQLGRATEALRSFSTAVDRGDETHRAGLGVAMALLATERAADAWSVLAALGKRFPEVSQVAHLVFRVGAQLGRWSEMVDPLERYVAIHQDDLAIRFATASVCVRRGDLERARHHYDALACHDPSYCGLQDLARELAMSA